MHFQWRKGVHFQWKRFREQAPKRQNGRRNGCVFPFCITNERCNLIVKPNGFENQVKIFKMTWENGKTDPSRKSVRSGLVHISSMVPWGPVAVPLGAAQRGSPRLQGPLVHWSHGSVGTCGGSFGSCPKGVLQAPLVHWSIGPSVAVSRCRGQNTTVD